MGGIAWIWVEHARDERVLVNAVHIAFIMEHKSADSPWNAVVTMAGGERFWTVKTPKELEEVIIG